MKKNPLLLILKFGILFCLALQIQAQEKDREDIARPSRYLLGKEEQMLLPVNILGLVRKPGQYMVPFRTDLISLIAYAGGFMEDAKIDEVKIVRGMGANDSNESNQKVFTVDVKKYFETGDAKKIPQLMPDDTVIVTGTKARTVNKVFTFFARLVPLAQLYFLIKVGTER